MEIRNIFFSRRRSILSGILAVLLFCSGCAAGQGNEDYGQAASTAARASADAIGKTVEESNILPKNAGGSAEGSKDDAGGSSAQDGEGENQLPARGLVVIDPGHQLRADTDVEPVGPGASEKKARVSGGTSGVKSGIPEYQLTLDIGLKLRSLLQERGFEVIMTRESNDVDISNSERAEIANKAGADVFVRLHANGVGDQNHTGAMTICQTSQNKYNADQYERSRYLSDCILEAYTESTGIDYERVWETDTMSGINWSRVPVTILEMGYMTNPEEDLLMQDPQMQEKMADGIAQGIEAYFDQYSGAEAGKSGDSAASATDGEGSTADDAVGTAEPAEPALLGSTAEQSGVGEASQTGSTAGQPGSGESAAVGDTAEQPIGDESPAAGSNGEQVRAAAPDGRVISTKMMILEKRLRREISAKKGRWSLYLYRIDTGAEISINAEDPMISASLIKLYVAGCYFNQVRKKKISDNYQNDLFLMISQSDNSATNRLIDLLGMEEINQFMKRHRYKAGALNRKMLEKNGKENYTSSADCGRVLRKVYEETYVNKDASNRLMEAMKAQIERNRHKIPAGVPKEVETANKTGELFTTDKEGVNVDVQNDAAIIFAPDHPYILVVMSSVPSVGETQLQKEIADLSAEVYKAICTKTRRE